MYTFLAVCLILAAANAKDLEPSLFQKFQTTVYEVIMQHLDAEYVLLQPAIKQQNETMNECMSMIKTRQETCMSCARSKCDGESIEWNEVPLSGPKNWFEGTAQRPMNTPVSPEVRGIGSWFKNAGNSFINWSGWTDMGNFFKNVFGNTGNIFRNVFSGLKLPDIFGRKRRDVRELNLTARRLQMIRRRYMPRRMEGFSQEVRECMERCSECTPFLDRTTLTTEVCGEQVLAAQRVMAEVIGRMEALFEAARRAEQGLTPMVSRVEYDEATCDVHTFTCSGVYVTANTPDGVVRYPSAYRYNVQVPHLTATEIALELVEKWGA